MKEYYTFTIVAGDYHCLNKCPFCISKMTTPIELSGKINLHKFKKAIKIAEKYNANNALITGKGEPTLFPEQITEILKLLKDRNFARIELQTDGFTLLNKSRIYPRVLPEWRTLGLDLIAISTYHYDLEKNMKIFGSTDVHELDTMIDIYSMYGFDIRLSCLMLKGYIDSIKQVKRMIVFAKATNVMQLTLRTLGKPTYSVSKAYSDAVDKYSVGYFNCTLVEWFDTNAKLIDILPHGARIYEYKKQNVCLTDCLTQDFGQEKVRQLIFYPNGWLCTNWEYPYGSRIL